MKFYALCFISIFTVARISQAVSNFELPVMNGTAGEVYKSADHPRTVFILENYFYNCPYCHQNAPNVDRMAEEFESNRQVQVLDVGIDSSDSLYEDWIAETSPNHPVVKDSARKLTGQLGTTGYPSTYVVDCNLNVTYKTSGVWSSSTYSTIRSKVNQALASCQAD